MMTDPVAVIVTGSSVAGLLSNGRVASDVDGVTVPAGFTRIVAFRSGLRDDGDGGICYRRFT